MKKYILLLVALICYNISDTYAQNISQSELSSIKVDELSDAQIKQYWERAQSEGYTIDQLEVIAKTKGVPAAEIAKLKRRISALRYSETTSEVKNENLENESFQNMDIFGLDGNDLNEVESNPLFGFDFFNNPNISFTPNLNLSTPENYVVGPGDELLIDIWGAAENNYKLMVDKEGAIRIQNVGPVYISGLSIKNARNKIISYLSKIYSGISAPSSSYEKVHADVSLVGVRTVQVNIIGEVKVPGTYSLSGLSTVLNALYACGGPTENGTFRSVQIIRNGQALEEFDFYKYIINGNEDGNVLLRDQDIIIVRPYESIIEVEGSVKRPGLYELKKEETIGDLVSFFSGFTSEAYQDRILVDRVNGSQREVSEIVLGEQPNFILRDGDKITVNEIIDRYENRVSISGAVYRPGTYELTKDLTLQAILKKSGGLKDDAFLDRGIIYRTLDDINKEIVSFSVKDVVNESANVVLQREDSIAIFSVESLKEEYTVTIDGAVNMPQTVEFMKNMQLEDLIAMSGGFKEGAKVTNIDVFRRLNDDKFETISKAINRSSSNNLEILESDNFYLEPFDRVSVRYLEGYTAQKSVAIKGEVKFPGSYSLTNKGERVSDLLEKSGGLSPYAYIEGAYLTRKVNNAVEKSQITLLDQLTLENDSTEIAVLEKEIKVGLNMKKILEGKDGSQYDLLLEEGDVLTIPSKKQTVTVRGEVLSPSLIQYNESKSLKDYVNSSGGFGLRAKKSKAYVVYANGNIKSTKKFLFFKSYPKVEPGSMVIVPEKAERQGLSAGEIIGLTSALASLALIVTSF